VLARWRKNFSQIINVHGVSDIRQIEIHTAEPLNKPITEPWKAKISPTCYLLRVDGRKRCTIAIAF
jgi:hypothetical protein